VGFELRNGIVECRSRDFRQEIFSARKEKFAALTAENFVKAAGPICSFELFRKKSATSLKTEVNGCGFCPWASYGSDTAMCQMAKGIGRRAETKRIRSASH
jgi:hypothetical protein